MWFLLFITLAFGDAKFSTEPVGCLENFTPPCSVLTHGKSEFFNPSFKLFSSTDTLFQFQSAHELYLARGVMWLITEKPLTVMSKFGKVRMETPGEYWIDVSAQEMIVKSIREALAVLPRGAQHVDVPQGFEMRVSLVDTTTHRPEYSVPMAMNLQKHLAALPKVFPATGINKHEYTLCLGRVVRGAAEESADLFQGVVQRKVSSAEERESRLKYERAYQIRRDSYLQKLFRIKNNFEDQ